MVPIATAYPDQTTHPENLDASAPRYTRSSSSCDISAWLVWASLPPTALDSHKESPKPNYATKPMDMRSSNMSRKSISGIAARLRSLLRYLYQARLVLTDLAPLVIGPSIYAYEGVPSIIDSTQIRAVLEETAKDKSPRGLRDYAILQILATYGLRDREIVRISIDDLDWRAATLRVSHRKTGTFSILPLSDAVGEALIEYLRHGRPQVESRNIFVLALAPYDVTP